MKKIGTITVGQAPRPDITREITALFDNKVEVIEVGVWDNVSSADMEQYKPKGDEDRLLTRFQDGTEIVYAERYIFPRMQACVDKLESQGVCLILMYCNGLFPEMVSHVPLIYPRDCMDGFIKAFAKNIKVAVLTPTEEFVPQWDTIWKRLTDNATIFTAHAYGDHKMKDLEITSQKIKAQDFDLISLDCMGYTLDTQEHLRSLTGKPVVLARTLMARMAAEYLG